MTWLLSIRGPRRAGQVHKTFLDIASTKGNKSQDKKKAMVIKLLAASTSSEAGYIMRALQVWPPCSQARK